MKEALISVFPNTEIKQIDNVMDFGLTNGPCFSCDAAFDAAQRYKSPACNGRVVPRLVLQSRFISPQAKVNS